MVVAASDLDSLIDIFNNKLLAAKNRPLSPSEIVILRGIWKYQTYNKIAMDAGYSPGYFTNVVAPELFKRLSQIIEQRITKKNCRVLLESYVQGQTTKDKQLVPQQSTNDPANTTNDISNGISNLPLRYPSGSIPLDSAYYI